MAEAGNVLVVAAGACGGEEIEADAAASAAVWDCEGGVFEAAGRAVGIAAAGAASSACEVIGPM